ncbi:MAG: D-2-hydroxyacid dehydrogenase [Ktedonobacterales bacterium]|nr:D-2-hydroxyacid dehydrogenase [Ktedonobacterales bacterium]
MDATISRFPHLLVSDYAFDPADAARLASAVGQEALLLVQGQEALRDALRTHPEVDLLCGFRPPADALELAPRLAWIALPSAGVDHVLRLGLIRPGGPLVTTANGVHAIPISEFVLSLMLQFARQWPEIHRVQREAAWPDHLGWERLHGHELAGATMGVVGLGAIGRQVARLGRALGMRVLATRHSARAGERDPEVDLLVPPDHLDDLLAEADYVILCLPSTPATHYLIRREHLQRMKPSAFLINISRGEIVDEEALIAALRAGAIAGAGLDVFESEPLPADSPLWRLPNVIISPHIAGVTDRYSQRFTDLLLANIGRYRAGAPLRNVVDAGRGY